MRKIITICFCLFMVNMLYSQSRIINSTPIENLPEHKPPFLSLGVGLGINNYCGLFGAGMKVNVYETFYLKGGVGIGSWGYKYSIGAGYDLKSRNSWGFGVYYEQASGIKGFYTDLDVINNGVTTKQKVEMDLKPVGSVNLTATKTWNFKRNPHNCFYIEMGLAFQVASGDMYKLKDENVVLSDLSKSTITMMSPGGLVFGVGFLFGM